MYLSNTVWASFGDSSVLCKETISIASYCFYSWFLANSHNMNCTEFRASLSITKNQNNNSHHYLYFLLLWQQFEEMELFDLYFAIVFFFSYLFRNWVRSVPSASSESVPVISMEPSFHRMYLYLNLIQQTDIPAQIFMPVENVSKWPTESVLCEQTILKHWAFWVYMWKR